MVDSRFFPAAAAFDLESLSQLTGASLKLPPGSETRTYSGVAPLDKAGADEVSFLDNVKYLDMFAASRAGACFVRPRYVSRAPAGMALLVTETPYYAFALATRHLYPEPAPESVVAPSAVIEPGAAIGQGARIDAGAVISAGADIGDDCWIGANTVIGAGVRIGKSSRIGALCTISHSIIGQRVIIHRGVHIGQDGFGFAPAPAGILKVPQMGRVIIGDDVEIGSGTCIDRGAGPDTTVGSHTKIDNLVQIGHNVQIGRFTLIAAQTGIAGSTLIGDGVMVGGQAGFSGHIHIGSKARIAARSGVMTDIPPGETYGGAPAVPVKDWHRQTATIAKLSKKRELIDE
jgi:UDP-3-O-[3-hydroxymyristoyl] glucosamine N-acyltransferase